MQDILQIESLDMEARGIGHLSNDDGSPGKVIFVEGALPGERVRFKSYRRKPKWEAADMTELLHESALRVKPKCEFFGRCGGCAMQHLEPSAQVAIKQRVLEDNLIIWVECAPRLCCVRFRARTGAIVFVRVYLYVMCPRKVAC